MESGEIKLQPMNKKGVKEKHNIQERREAAPATETWKREFGGSPFLYPEVTIVFLLVLCL